MARCHEEGKEPDDWMRLKMRSKLRDRNGMWSIFEYINVKATSVPGAEASVSLID